LTFKTGLSDKFFFLSFFLIYGTDLGEHLAFLHSKTIQPPKDNNAREKWQEIPVFQ